MTPGTENRPDPDVLLNLIRKEEQRSARGKLKIFFGMCAGVGKTYDMLKSAHEALSKKIDVVVGYVEPHKRPETLALLENLPGLPGKKIEYRGAVFDEMDTDAILDRKPQIVLVDELAHSNVPGSRHAKRYQDVLELLENGIDVYTTLNVQHLESRSHTVTQITQSAVNETVPDSVFENADEIVLVDISPDELLKRLSEGKIYSPESSSQAIQNFFRKENLSALREMSLRLTAERVEHQIHDYMQASHIRGPWKSLQRLIVGIDASGRSLDLIRWSRRIAYTTHSEWAVVHVESSRPMSESEKNSLSKNIKLARELGAEAITISDENIASGLIRAALQQNATQLIIGKTRSIPFFRKSLHDELIRKSGNLDVYVVGAESEKITDQKRRLRFDVQSGWPQYLVAASAVFFVSLVCFPFTDFIGYQSVSFVFLLIISLLPLRLGPGPVLLAATLGAALWNYLFIPPIFTFTVGLFEDRLMLGMFFIIAITSGVLSARVRAREQAIRQREERTTALYMLTRELTTARTQGEVIRVAASHIQRFFNGDVIAFISDLDGEFINTPVIETGEQKTDAKEHGVAAWAYWNEKKAGRFTDTLPFAEASYFPLSGPRYPLGVIGIRLKEPVRMTFDQETLFENFIKQIASSLEREQLNELARKTMVVEESEKLYKTIFESISHEFKTPIATILGSVEQLQGLKNPVDSNVMLGEIHDAAERLHRLVSNLLDQTRLESGFLKPKPDWCDVSDLIQTTMEKLKKELVNRKIDIRVEPDMPLVKVDIGLMEQVLTNLIHNAINYTPSDSPIEVEAAIDGGHWTLSVSDHGPGIPPEASDKIFQKFYRVPGSRTGGTGLGLSITRGFVEIQGGTIRIEASPDQGAHFVIRLPLEKSPVLEKSL